MQTAFTHPININNWPTYTAMFKTSNTNNFEVGIQDSGNSWTRCMVHGGNGAFTTFMDSYGAGSYNSFGINVPFSANTWYFGQFVFTGASECLIYIWQAGYARPNTPSAIDWMYTIPNPVLVFQDNGDNASNLNSYSIGSVTMTSEDTSSGTVGYGVSQMSIAPDGSNWTCPPYGFGGWCVYATQPFPWTFSGGDGKKTLWYQFLDTTGNGNASGTSSIIYDTTPPVVNSISPGTDSEVRGIATVQVHATDPPASDGSSSGVGSAVLYVDGVQAGSPVSGTSVPTFLWDTTTLSAGVHILTAKATDAAGNTGAVGGSTQVIVDNTSSSSSAIVSDGPASTSVNVANGDAIVSHTDFSLPGRGPELTVTRTYHSLSTQQGFFGLHWSSNLDEHLVFPGNGDVTYFDAIGGSHVFLPNGSGGYLTSPGLYITLVKNGDGSYTIMARDQGKTNFNSRGQLTSIVDRHGNTLTITYDDTGFPTTMTDAAGRKLTITGSNGDITQITDPAGNAYKYTYASGSLADFINPQNVEIAYNLHSIPGLLTSFTLNYTNSFPAGDSQTNVTTALTYDSENRLVKVLDPLNYDMDLSYSTLGSTSQTVVQRLQGISPATYTGTTYQR